MRRVLLLTRGSPTAVSGGHLYHRRMAAAAAPHDAEFTFGPERLGHLVPAGYDVVVLDSIAAWRMAPAMLVRRRRRGSSAVVAIVHQVPGGVDTPPRRRRIQQSLDRFVYRRGDAVIAASATLAEALADEHGLDPARVHIVEPGCDLPPGTPSKDLRQGRKIAVLSVANWLPNKGVMAVLEAVAGLHPGAATLHLAGRDDVDPEYTSQVRRRLERADLDGRVVVHGALDRPALAGLYAGADVFVLASAVEGYATVCAEALAAGLPVVGWRRPYLERLVTDGVEGRLVPAGDVTALRATLRQLAEDEPARLVMAEAARRRGATLPTWDDTATAFFAVLRTVAWPTPAPSDALSGA